MNIMNIFKNIIGIFNAEYRAGLRIKKFIIRNLKTDQNGWAFTTLRNVQQELEEYTFTNNSRNIKFILKTSPIRITIVNPIVVTIDDDICSVTNFLTIINKHSNFNKNEFLSAHIKKDGYHLIELSKKIINVFTLRFWCYHNISNKYFIDVDGSGISISYNCEEYRCWFEDKADAVHFQMMWAGSNNAEENIDSE